MEYISTRDENRRLCAAQAIAAGLSPEGGLFLPEELPSFSPEEIQEMMDMDYQERAALVLSRWRNMRERHMLLPSSPIPQPR